MTNQQRAVVETAKFFLTVIVISLVVIFAVLSGHAPWLGVAASLAVLVYGAIIIYEIKLSQIEAQQRHKENV